MISLNGSAAKRADGMTKVKTKRDGDLCVANIITSFEMLSV